MDEYDKIEFDISMRIFCIMQDSKKDYFMAREEAIAEIKEEAEYSKLLSEELANG